MTENEAINYLRQIDPKHIECVELIDMKEVWENIPQAISIAEKALKEIQQHRAIGTVEECREARERQRGKKPNKSDAQPYFRKHYNNIYSCPLCNKKLTYHKQKKCQYCGQSIAWSDTP